MNTDVEKVKEMVPWKVQSVKLQGQCLNAILYTGEKKPAEIFQSINKLNRVKKNMDLEITDDAKKQ